MLMFSDMLTVGIVRQFPAKFSKAAGVPVRSRTERGWPYEWELTVSLSVE